MKRTFLPGWVKPVVFLFPVACLGADYTISPRLVKRGTATTIAASEDPCDPAKSLMAKARLETAAAGLAVSSVKAVDCRLSATLKVGQDAAFGPAHLNLTAPDNGAEKTLAILSLDVVDITPEPTPPGLETAVDVMWKVLPWRQVADSYGRKVADQYFAVEISLGNNSGYPLLLETIGFRPEGLGNAPIPNDAYAITRSTIEREQQVGRRALAVGGFQGMATLAAGVAPFVKNTGSTSPEVHVGSRAQYGFWLGLTNPLLTGLNFVWPDKTVRHLVAMDTRVFRGAMIIKNNDTRTVNTFISREMVECKADCEIQERNATFTRIPYNRKSFKPVTIMKKLGKLVIVGEKVEYLSRVRVVAGSEPSLERLRSVTQEITLDKTGMRMNATENVTLTGSNARDAKLELPPGSSGVTVKVVENTDNRVVFEIKAAPDAKLGANKVIVDRAGEKKEFPFEIKP